MSRFGNRCDAPNEREPVSRTTVSGNLVRREKDDGGDGYGLVSFPVDDSDDKSRQERGWTREGNGESRTRSLERGVGSGESSATENRCTAKRGRGEDESSRVEKKKEGKTVV